MVFLDVFSIDLKNCSFYFQFSASVDTTRITRESDFEKLDQCIPFLIRSSVGNLLNVRILDPAIAKIYIISQLSLQYLLFCTKFLDKSVYSLRENIFDYQKKFVKLEEILAQRDDEIEQLTKKIKRKDAMNQHIFPCTKCTKNFLSSALLENHIQRKHVQESKDKDSNLINTIKLELEIKQLKERLNMTEKELMNVPKKQLFECEKCRKNAEKSYQSVAIQSNFEEKEKDDVEKDAISEMLNKQMRNFEEWKEQTESRYHSEISELRGKLDAIEMQKKIENVKEKQKVQTQPPSPAPRLSSFQEKPNLENVLWKARYGELEKMYEANQQRMALTVKSIEATYNEKMTKFEKSVEILTEEREKIREDLVKKSLEVEGKTVESLTKLPEVAKFETKLAIPLTPRVTIRNQETSSSSSLPESEDEIDEIKILPQNFPVTSDIEESPEPEPEPQKPKSIMEVFSAQKFVIRPNKPKPQLRIKESVKSQETTGKVAEKLYNQRLKSMGIPQNLERLKKFEYEKVYDQMVTKRETIKSQHKSFFITRKNLKSKVDKIFSSKHKDSRNKSKPERAIGDNVRSALDIDNYSDDIQKLPQPSTSQKFHEDLEQILAKRISSSTLKKESNEDKIPTKSKKVLFNMKNLEDPQKSDIREVNEDDSDFEISSFSNFTVDDEK